MTFIFILLIERFIIKLLDYSFFEAINVLMTGGDGSHFMISEVLMAFVFYYFLLSSLLKEVIKYGAMYNYIVARKKERTILFISSKVLLKSGIILLEKVMAEVIVLKIYGGDYIFNVYVCQQIKLYLLLVIVGIASVILFHKGIKFEKISGIINCILLVAIAMVNLKNKLSYVLGIGDIGVKANIDIAIRIIVCICLFIVMFRYCGCERSISND